MNSGSDSVAWPTEPPFGPIMNGTQVVIFYHYRPNQPAAYTFLALFAIATLGHLAYLFRLRAWYFIPLLLGGVAEVFGYYGRSLSHDDPNNVGPWILQNFLLLSAAPLIAATVYMTLGRLINALDAQRFSLVSTRWLAKVYVLIDVACLGSQIAGSVMPASGDESVIETSKKAILGGLAAQIGALCFFLFLTWHAKRRISRGAAGLGALMSDPSLNWKNHFRVLEAVIVLITIRSLVRMIEYGQGEKGFVITHEVFIYIFDALLMFVAMAASLVLHPSRLIRDVRAAKGADPMLKEHMHIRLNETA